MDVSQINKSRSSVSPNNRLQQKKEEDKKIYTEKYIALEEDEISQVRVIFDSFDIGNRGKISIEYLAKILRLLNYNIGNNEL